METNKENNPCELHLPTSAAMKEALVAILNRRHSRICCHSSSTQLHRRGNFTIITRITLGKIRLEASVRLFRAGFSGEKRISFDVRNKHRASVEGYSELIKTCAITVPAPLGFMVRAKLPDYIKWKLGCSFGLKR